MNGVLGELLPLAVGIAISPVPIISVILMLLAPKATGTSLGFLAGWVVGVVVAVALFVVLANVAGLSSSSEPSTAASWTKIVLGLALLALAGKQWRSRPGPGEEAALPKWMAAIDTFTPAKAFGLAFLLAAVNPKNLALCIAAGVAFAAASLSTGEVAVAIAVFTLIAVATVAVPVVAYLVARERMRAPLDSLRTWLVANNATVMAVLLLVIGVDVLGKGIAGL